MFRSRYSPYLKSALLDSRPNFSSELIGQPRRYIAHARCAVDGRPPERPVENVAVVHMPRKMTTHLPIHLKDWPAAFVSGIRSARGYNQVPGNSIQAIANAFAPIEAPSGGKRDIRLRTGLERRFQANSVGGTQDLRLAGVCPALKQRVECL